MANSALPRTGYLSTPLTPEEQRFVARMYREHNGLLHMLGRRFCKKYPNLHRDDIYSCINTGFIKSCRAWDPAKGRFSTILAVFCEGDVMHFIRDSNWAIKAPCNVRHLGTKARRLAENGHSTTSILEVLGITPDQLKNALLATESSAHDHRDFEDHVCPRPTPFELLELAETSV